ncbi:DoxX family protein [Sphingobium yanoikuyae]|uniref:DoxX family protein n=1 Tax=Sphingobium yanoikuyae TaxID=13690 RepID=UPI00241C9ACE|nr:DoxX family protein [Sphingobium yanoikuyae]
MAQTYAYWISTVMLSVLYLSSAGLYLARRDYVREVLRGLGYHAAYLVPIMAVIKILAVLAILSRFNVALSDLAYAGILYHLLLSGIAHLGVRKPGGAIPAVVGLILLIASFATQNAAREKPSPYAPAATSLAIMTRN